MSASTVALQTLGGIGLERALVPVARALGVGIGSLGVAAVAALVYRWYTREQVPQGVTYLFSLAVAAFYLQTVGLFSAVLNGTAVDFFELETVFTNLFIFALAALAAPVGRVVGDRIATDVFAFAGVKQLDAEVSRLVRTVGRVTDVTLPEEVEDIEGYDPIDAETKTEMAGKTLLFPRRLSVAELRDRIATRLKDDYGVGHVDVDVDDDGTVTYLAVGSRAAGVGPTLAPGAVAVAVRADPPHSASAGDVVQVWALEDPVSDGGSDATDGGSDAADAESASRPASEANGASADADERAPPKPTRVATAELRAVAGDVVTLVVDEADAAALDADRSYRLLTMPAEPKADREFASLLRTADETMGVVTVRGGSGVEGLSVGDLDTTVAAIKPAEGRITPIPTRKRTLEAGDDLYVVARPDTLRRLQARVGDVEDGS